MRMRNKPWAKPELEACPYFVKDPESMKGKWAEALPQGLPFYIELGCGKGGFAAQMITADTGINYLAIDIEFKMLGVARRKIARALEEAGLPADHILLAKYNIEKLSEMFAEEERLADRLYINFCNPWPRKKHNKHRLTHPRQLEQYKGVLKKGGEILFRTDDDPLFQDSIGYFQECGFRITELTEDLHNSEYDHRIMTEHEEMFSSEGIPIKYLKAVYE